MSTAADQHQCIRVAYAGDDSFVTCLRSLLDRPGVELAMTLTADDDRYTATVESLSLAAGAKVVRGDPGRHGWDELDQAGIDLLVSAAYGYLIPIDRLVNIPTMINVHPSLLPEGRGPNPLPYIASGRPDVAGVSIHLIDATFDTGPILLQRRLEGLSQNPSLSDLTIGALALAPVLLNALLDDLPQHLANAKPQGKGSYWPAIDDSESIVDLVTARDADIESTIHRFACQGLSFRLADGRLVNVETANFVRTEHDFQPGRLLGSLRSDLLLSANDGLIRAFPFRDETIRGLEISPQPNPAGRSAVIE